LKNLNVDQQHIVVLGLARSGVAVARLLHFAGAKVIVNDKKPREACPEAEELENLGIPIICGHHPVDLIHEQVDLVVKNPGIPYHIPPLVQAAQLNIPIVTEVEIAYRISSAPIIGVTGSNGKTTTTTWIGKMLEHAGRHPVVAGNIGRALCEVAKNTKEEEILVVELSSFQLKGIQTFRPNIACLLNIYEAHLDYHRTMQDYIASKAKLFANQAKDDIAVINLDCPKSVALLPGIRARLFPFTMTKSLSAGVFLEKVHGEDHIVAIDFQENYYRILNVNEIGIPGRHNVENALAATAVAISAGVSIDIIREVLCTFRGVEHRIEWVKNVEGVEFYNDSKATNPQATTCSLDAFTRPVILIAGGLDRGIDFMELLPHFQNKVKAVVALGESAEKIMKIANLAGISEALTVDTVNAAVKAAYALAQDGDTVLLSPACASWDMFSSFEERGRIFKESVHML
jgi:UDP-N-acetylmuramoylalanine--D-glutamate ligase